MSSLAEEIEMCDVSSRKSSSKQSSSSKPPRPIPANRRIRPKSQIDVTSDDISEITNSESTSISDVRSYRDKIKDRFMTVKNQSLKKTTKLKRFKSHASNILNLNKSIELMRRENLEINERIKQTQVVVQESAGNISKTEMYHFFCESIEDNLETDVQLSNANQSTEDLLSSSLVEFKSRADLKLNEIFETESKIFWKPSSRYWFNSENELKFLENPYSEIAFRPFDYSSISKLETFYHKASLNPPIELSGVTISTDATLQVDIQSLKFKHHSLFSAEHVLEELLIRLYDTHREFVVSNKIERLEKKLNALRLTKTSRENADKIIDEHELEFEQHLMKYKEELAEWKNDKTKVPKPRKPIKDIDVELIRDDLQTVFRDSIRVSGEPKLSFNITHDNEVTKIVEDNQETSRRCALEALKIQMRFLCNDVEVCKTKPKLSTVPEYFSIELYETSKLFKKKIVDITVTAPHPNKTKRDKLCEMLFSTKEEVVHKHAGVGCGKTISEMFKDTNLDFNDCLQTSGFLNYSLSWNNRLKNDSAPNEISEILHNGVLDYQKLDDWTQKSNIDPEDPKTAVIFNYLKMTKSEQENREQTYFRCDPFLSSLEICKREDLEDNIRFKLLELRDKGEPEFSGMIVPNRIKEIPENIFTNYKKRIAEENLEEYLQEDDYENEINSRRSHGRKYLQQMHMRIFQMCRNTDHNLTYEDVVNEQVLLYIQLYVKTIIHNVLNWFRFQPNPSKSLPNLKPYETEALNIIENAAPPKVKIILLSAINIPTRFDTTDKADAKEIHPYVEISFVNVKVRSKTSEGKDASWNEELKISLETINTDYLNPNALIGSLSIKLFDDLDESTKIYLGCVQVPISAIFESNKMEGSFLVKLPEVIIGYKKAQEGIKNVKKTNDLQSCDTYINMKISTDHNVPKLYPDMKSFSTNEPSYIRQHVLDWNTKYNETHLDRKFSALVFDSNGKATCITRFIKPLEPPQIIEDDFDITLDQCARYISLIPVTNANKFYQHMWLTTEQLLKLGIGSLIDHAVALMCFLLSLKLEVWLILGFGIPHGSTAYILIREYNVDSDEPTHFIYDISTCKKYNITDTYCPLQKVYCIVNESNIWGNIQRNDDITNMSFDLNRRFDWIPLFNQQVTAPTYTVQKKLLYVTTYDVQKLQYSIEKKLRKKLSKLLPTRRIVWNHYISNSLKQTLSKFEKYALHGKKLKMKDLFEQLQTHKMSGYIYNYPFSNINTIVNEIIVDKFQLDENDDKLEMASAVIVQSYPNQVLSIWLILLTINSI
ncbi:PREDICTED: coiled-coil and C2 domain-containing protein 2A [Nicrophorus vespilloides]|uniref:Coiled-coil and C2 domain-containing protein 2A n=1 Tax=Nicrophorus vespilloides TaxID=110193 RepID=A0ABM1N6U6_NICVS|nr:PREDICTED: coiled-coil and C2 domain-containing protein 2A [Nicrophorus vespilloides]